MPRGSSFQSRTPPDDRAGEREPALVPLRQRAPSRDWVLRRWLLACDMLALSGALAASLALAAPDTHWPEQLLWSLALLPAWALLLKLYGLYDRDARRVSHSTVDDVPALFHATFLVGLAEWVWLKWTPPRSMVLAQGLLLVALTLLLVPLARAAARRLVRGLVPSEPVLFVGGGAAAELLVRKIVAHPEYALEPVGYLGDERATSELLGDGLPRLGSVDDVTAVCRERRIERLIIVAASIESGVLVRLIRDAHEVGLKVSVLPHAFDVLGPATELDDVEGVTVLGINPPALSRSSRALKRSLDLVLSIPLAIVSLPLLPLIALLIKLDSRGPVLYRQERIGRGGRTFRVQKFRTMVKDAEEQVEELQARSAHSAWLLLEKDPRVTRVGRLLRELSLDELPQLWNVLRGEMSLVGPRPMAPEVHAHISGWGLRRLDLTPGLTGLWQALGRTGIPFEEMITLDYIYVTNWSLWGDVRLLSKTFHAVVTRRGAN